MAVEPTGRNWTLLISGLAAVVLLAGAAFFTATRLPGTTTLAGTTVADEADADAALDAAQQALDELPILLTTAAGSEVTVSGADLGLEVDRERSTDPVRTGLPSIQTWFRRVVQGPQANPLVLDSIETAPLTRAAEQLTVAPTNADVLVEPAGIEVTEADDGLDISAGAVEDAVIDAVAQVDTVDPSEWPDELTRGVDGTAAGPTVQQADIDAVIAQIETLESADVTLVADTPAPPTEGDGGTAVGSERIQTEITLSPRELRALVTVEEAGGGELILEPDLAAAPARVIALLDLAQIDPIIQARIENRSPTPGRGEDLTDVASITGDIVLEDSQGGFVPNREATLAGIIEAGLAGGGTVAVQGDSGEQATPETIGIVEPISTFTTFYTAGQSRNINIQRMAEIVDNTIIPAGETYELNHAVGRRTVDNGFVAGGAIIDGELTTDIGGGVSQFATTFFNAAWFAGIELVDWKAHSIYFSRYPAGREATVNYPNVNLEVRNDTPHAILVDTEADANSVTVTFWSLPYWQVETISGPCACGGEFSITVDRIRTPPDGAPIQESWTTFYTVERPRDS